MSSTDIQADTVRPARRLSAVLSALSVALMVGWPAFIVYLSVFEPTQMAKGLGLSGILQASSTPSLAWVRSAVFVVAGLVPVAFLIYALVCARRCFRSFMRGAYFTSQVVRGLRGFAGGMAFYVAAGLLMTPLSSLLLTLGGDRHAVAAGIGSGDLLTLLFAGIVWQIADVMTRAVTLAEDSAQIV